MQPTVIGEKRLEFSSGNRIVISNLGEVVGQVVVEVAIVGGGGPTLAGLSLAVGGKESLVGFSLAGLAQFGGDVVAKKVVECDA
jgi:hypothetical protein